MNSRATFTTETPINIFQNNTIILQCDVSSAEKNVKITWKSNNSVLKSYKHKSNTNETFFLKNKLIIDFKINHKTNYECIVTGNSGNRNITTFTVYPTKNYKKNKDPYYITLYIKYLISFIGQDVFLPCESLFDTKWSFDDKYLITSSKKYKIVKGGIHIKNILWEDMGVYKCATKDYSVETFLYPALH